MITCLILLGRSSIATADFLRLFEERFEVPVAPGTPLFLNSIGFDFYNKFFNLFTPYWPRIKFDRHQVEIGQFYEDQIRNQTIESLLSNNEFHHFSTSLTDIDVLSWHKRGEFLNAEHYWN